MMAEIGLASLRESHSFAPLGLVCFAGFPHGLRRGLDSCAASRLFSAIRFAWHRMAVTYHSQTQGPSTSQDRPRADDLATLG
jgi:hypothetical protein